MTAVEADCLHSQLDAVANTAEAGNVTQGRLHLAEMLRCASRLDCAQAVSCSDDAMGLLRRLLAKSDG